MREQALQTVFLRVALAAGFFSAVADRFGIWGQHGAPGVAWGDMEHFLNYTAKVNPWFSGALVTVAGWAATIAEIALGSMLLIGFQTRWAARLSGWLLVLFGIGMTAGTGVKAPLDYSVFAAAGGAFLLATARGYLISIDEGVGRSAAVVPAQDSQRAE